MKCHIGKNGGDDERKNGVSTDFFNIDTSRQCKRTLTPARGCVSSSTGSLCPEIHSVSHFPLYGNGESQLCGLAKNCKKNLLLRSLRAAFSWLSRSHSSIQITLLSILEPCYQWEDGDCNYYYRFPPFVCHVFTEKERACFLLASSRFQIRK